MVNNVCSNSVNHKEYLKKRFGLVSLPIINMRHFIGGFMFSIKTFEDRHNPNKKFHHVNMLGLKFRIANNKRRSKRSKKLLYSTQRGVVLNLIPSRYLCLITK